MGAPGESSIDAALNPAQTDYLYYVRDPARDDGAHNFYSKSADFEKGVRALREWERTHQMPDPSEWDAIFVGLGGLSVRAIQRATGVAPATCQRIKRGEGKAHPRHWEALRKLSSG